MEACEVYKGPEGATALDMEEALQGILGIFYGLLNFHLKNMVGVGKRNLIAECIGFLGAQDVVTHELAGDIRSHGEDGKWVSRLLLFIVSYLCLFYSVYVLGLRKFIIPCYIEY